MFAFTDRSWLLRYVQNCSDRTEGNQWARSEGRAIAFWSLRVGRSLNRTYNRDRKPFLGHSNKKMTTRQILINVPESVLQAENTDADAFARELCLLAAVKLYELGRLSSGRAAELAGMSRVEFLMNLGRYKVFPLEAELQDLEGNHA